MNEIQTCKKCLYTEYHPLGITFDSEGVCSGCRIHEEKYKLDWEKRWRQLIDLVSPYKSKSGKNYDCIVPVDGSPDSHFILHIVKNELGMNPLVVTNNKYFNTPLGIWNLSNLRIKFDINILCQNINPNIVKKITKNTLIEIGSIYWPCIAGQTSFPVQTAVRYRIPLIIWGAHQGVEQVGMFSHEHDVEMTRRYRKDHDLMGYEADDLLNAYNDLREEDIYQYRYPDDYDLKIRNVRGIYLSNFIRWDPKKQQEKMIHLYGCKTATHARTFNSYEHTDCFNYMNLHDYLKKIKHGYGKVVDHASQEIRHGRLSYEQARGIVSYYEDIPPMYLQQFCEWVGMDIKSLGFVLGQFSKFPYSNKFNQFASSGVLDVSEVKIPQNPSKFIVNSSLALDEKNIKYITVGKGYP